VNARRLVALLVAGLVLLVGLAACASPTDEDTRSATAGMPDLQQELAAQHWRLDRADSSITTGFEQTTTIDFHDDGSVSGRALCNGYRGRYTTDLDSWSVTITHVATTKRACRAATMRAEREYLHALTLVRDVDFSDGGFHVVLDNDTGDRLSYDAYDSPREP
jgi:heat shock protein HslJ